LFFFISLAFLLSFRSKTNNLLYPHLDVPLDLELNDINIINIYLPSADKLDEKENFFVNIYNNKDDIDQHEDMNTPIVFINPILSSKNGTVYAVDNIMLGFKK